MNDQRRTKPFFKKEELTHPSLFKDFMLACTLSFLIGILFLQQFAQLPPLVEVECLLFLLIMLAIFFIRRVRFIYLFIACCCGFGWALGYATYQSDWQIPLNWEGKPVMISGDIANIPYTDQHNTGFLLALQQFNHTEAHGLLHLTWRQCKQHLKVGERWQLVGRLKRIHGTLNPGGFDYEAMAFQSGIRGQGYIVPNKQNQRLAINKFKYPIDRLRQHLKEQIAKNLPQSLTSPWIMALALGERHSIAAEQWQILRNTGTNHLMAIAGLHIGSMAMLAHFLVAWLWRRSPHRSLQFPAIQAGALAALSMAVLYSVLAGFSIPTQRACLMLTVFLTALLLRRNIKAWQGLSIALLVILLFNPLDVLTDSFWLSFGSVALIIYGVSGRLHPTGLWWKYGRIQWVIALGLIPLSVWLFQQCSLISFLANSVAIPCVAFLIVPLTLFGTLILLFSATAGGMVLMLADKILGWLWIILSYFSHLPGGVWNQGVPPHWALAAACIGMIILLLPAGFPGRWFGAIWLLPLIFCKSLAPKMGEVSLSLLDVGQGLSAVVRTHHHLLVFDTGPKLSDAVDMGESVVAPFLHAQRVKHIDMLVISHGDNDHIGGMNSVLKQFAVRSIKTSVPEKMTALNTSLCLRGESWVWDQVRFTFLYPDLNNLNLNNDSSCVLRITTGTQSILLTGDIEKYAENNLLRFNKQDLAATVLIAPHHGSKTSAVADFVATVHPQYVLFATGYRNRYHFPHQEVVEKYQALGAKLFATATSGEIDIHVTPDQTSMPELYRKKTQHYWNFI